MVVILEKFSNLISTGLHYNSLYIHLETIIFSKKNSNLNKDLRPKNWNK